MFYNFCENARWFVVAGWRTRKKNNNTLVITGRVAKTCSEFRNGVQRHSSSYTRHRRRRSDLYSIFGSSAYLFNTPLWIFNVCAFKYFVPVLDGVRACILIFPRLVVPFRLPHSLSRMNVLHTSLAPVPLLPAAIYFLAPQTPFCLLFWPGIPRGIHSAKV